ncbi:MAG: helix-turn-helix transcriptional regulator [Rickettsiales bacterium]
MTPHPVDIYVGKRLRMRRVMLGMSQESVGKAIGVTFQQIQKYERGANRMGSSRLYDFSQILTVPVSYFFEGYEQETGGSIPTTPMGFAEEEVPFEHEKLTSRETLEVMRAYYSIRDPKVRKKMLDLMRSLGEEVEELQ